MLNAIWLSMLLLSVVVGFIQGRIDLVVQSITESAKFGVEVVLGLAGIMSLWLGIMAIASKSGLINHLARFLKPVMRILFPEVPIEHPAMGAMILNLAANMLGMIHAATPFGLQAMRELQSLNKNTQIASDAMCTFIAINVSSVQLIPATAMAFLAANGCSNPSSIILTSLIATSISTITAIVAVKKLAKMSMYQTEAITVND